MASSSSCIKRYHVFPSFHGPDVRSGFLSHLRHQFASKGITTFKDHEIERGHTIGPELVQAIRESRVSVILLSKNYASSSWCLDELVEILNCKEASGQIVMTIFYQVDPSDVRKQTGDFGIAFKKTCEKKTEEDKKRWMEALAYVANIAGEHSLNWTDEAAMVEKFATDVSNKLNVTLSRDFEEIVGLQAHLRKLISLLCFECDEAKMIGIWGPAGIGKSTIARALFNHLSSDFRLRCFMGNLKGSYTSIMGAHGIQDIYHVDFPSSKEALEILCLAAFKQRYVQDDFEKVANRVAYLCGYLPLGLCVVGSSLRGESKEEWELQLSRIEASLDRKIEDILRVGYDRLSKKNQSIFLHIACMFNDTFVDDYVTSMLADSNLDVENGMKTLAVNSLVKFSNPYCKKSLDMHYLLKQLGRQVVHEQADEPGKRQYLVEPEEIRDVLTKETGTGSVIGDMEYLPHLRLLHWDSYPRKRLPPTFQPQCLVELCMDYSNLKKLWGGIQPLANLKTLNLGYSMKLKEIPNLSEATNLETLTLEGCTSLVELPSSIRNLHKLEKLNLKGCKKLRIIPTNINLASLEEVNMDGCSRLRTFPDISRNISRLDVRNTKIEDVPASVAESWLRLEKFHIGSKSLKRLTHVPECVSNLDLSNSAIKKIPDCVIGLPGLRSLSIINCRKLVSLQGLPPSLLSLDADDCVLLKSVCLSFSEPKSAGIRLFNCFSLEEEARRVIIQQCDYESVCLPGKEIPPDFTHRAKGNSITIISSGTFSASSRFKACLLLPPDEYTGRTVCRLISKGVVINKLEFYSFHHTLLSEHLLVFSGAVLKEHICCELEATTSEIRFEFDRKYVIECGVQMLADEGEIKLASSFHDPNREVRFINCMKLDEEARRAIVQGWAYKYVCFPGKQIPAEFTHKATGNSITITKGTLSASTSFRACILLSPNLQHPSDYRYQITCCLRSKSVLINDLECYPNSRSWYISGWDHRPLLTEHLFVFHGSLFKKRRWVEVDSDIQFEFSCDQEHYKITECGLQILAEEGERSSRERKEPSGEAVKVSKDENVFKTSKHTSWWRENVIHTPNMLHIPFG
ncbi:BnaA04g11180D [Brassica napus]|uniref:ADP-ribosyl cyclase/cyclic ADP-ribose hydrolase n=1 Tax=Brassica napus TaxID=3708 RepID=A0A078HMI3_BRANA|nr:unnamed protein product [Brassica napus]CDY39735.1 BnaA04g11180D [Brassica napus]